MNDLMTIDPIALADLPEDRKRLLFAALQADQLVQLTKGFQQLKEENSQMKADLAEANRKAELAIEIHTKRETANSNPAYLSIKQLADSWSPSITFPTLKVLLTKAGVLNGHGRPYAEHTDGKEPLAYEKESFINGHPRAFWAYHEERLRRIVFSYLKRINQYEQYLTCTDRKTLTDFIDHL